MSYRERYEYFRLAAEETLRGAVPADVPEPLASAMRYSLLAGGKRLRPVLLLAAYNIVQADITPALPFAAALAMVFDVAAASVFMKRRMIILKAWSMS